MKWIKLFDEATKTPSDLDAIVSSIADDDSTMMTPTIDFLKNVYSLMNKRMFFNNLPQDKDMEFELKSDSRGRWFGLANAYRDVDTGVIQVNGITLNTAKTQSMRNWIETIVHEMIHLCDYVTYPEHFSDKSYDEHGEWFLNEAKRFKKIGLTITPQNHSDNGVDDENKRIMNMIGKEIYVQIGKTNDGLPQIFKILTKNKEKCFKVLKKKGYRKVILLSTENPKSVELKPTFPKDGIDFKVWYLGDEFDRHYGPFKKIEVVDLQNMLVDENFDPGKSQLPKGVKVIKTIGRKQLISLM